MRDLITRSFVLLAVVTMIASNFTNTNHAMANDSSGETNPLLAKWEGPFGGVPPFDRVQIALFKPALEAAMAEQLTEIQRIAADPAPPDFDNTITALERSGRTLDRVGTLYGVWGATMSNPEFQVVQREMAPRLAAFNNQITQNEALFKRIEAVYNSPAKSRMTPEQQRVTWLYHTNYVRAGARLNADVKKRLSQINQQLAGLYTKFSQNVLAEETDQFIVLKSEDELAGLPQSLRDAAAAAAETKKQPGAWVIMNTRSSIDPFLTYSARRDLREKAWRMFINRGDNGGEHDNNAITTEILQLRAERAKLLGYPTHAHWRLENTMAKTPERALELMEAVWKPAVARVREEVADMQALADKEGERLHVGDLLADARNGRLPDRLHQLHRALGRLRHRVLDAPVRVRRVAEQLRALGAQLQNLGDD